MPQVVTVGVTYAELLNDLRVLWRNEFQDQLQAAGLAFSSTPAIGGIELAQEVTGLSKNTIYSLCSKRQMPHSKPEGSNKLFFNRAELLEWVAAGSRKQQKTR